MNYFYLTFLSFIICGSHLHGQCSRKIDSSSYELNHIYWIFGTADFYDKSYIEIDSIIGVLREKKPIKIEILVTQYISSSVSRYWGLLRAERLKSYFIHSGFSPEIIIAKSKRIDEETFSKTKTQVLIFYERVRKKRNK